MAGKLVRWLCTTVYQTLVLDPASIKGVEWVKAALGPFCAFDNVFYFDYHFLVGSGVPDVAQCKVTGSPGAICERYLDRSIWREVFFFTSRCTLTRSQEDTRCGGSLSRGSKLTIFNNRKASVSDLSRTSFSTSPRPPHAFPSTPRSHNETSSDMERPEETRRYMRRLERHEKWETWRDRRRHEETYEM